MPLPLRVVAGLAALVTSAAGRADSPKANPAAPPTDLADYVRKPDPSFRWELTGKTATPNGTVYDLKLTSQTWQGIPWRHGLQVFVPAGDVATDTALLWNQGGNPNPATALLGVLLAGKVKAPVVFLYGVPNQPLFGGKKEDALIAETFVRYLGSKDPSWPLLFPMAKSVVAAMDAVQAVGAKEWGKAPARFVVTGASKRGWTSWMTAASGDPRVAAIAPMVIDTLNFPAQMRNQVAAFGKPSEMIRDYVDRGLVPIPDGPEAKHLWRMVDPWVYRSKLALPKMLIFGTNDPYWPLDALNSYWDDLPGEKHVLYVPNAGHGLTEEKAKGGKDRDRAVNTLSAFCRSQVTGKPLPAMTWKYTDRKDAPVLEVTPDRPVKAVRVWVADAPTRDFRKARWSSSDLPAVDAGPSRFAPDRPADGFRAVFGEAEFERDGLTFTLSTQVRVLEPKK